MFHSLALHLHYQSERSSSTATTTSTMQKTTKWQKKSFESSRSLARALFFLLFLRHHHVELTALAYLMAEHWIYSVSKKQKKCGTWIRLKLETEPRFRSTHVAVHAILSLRAVFMLCTLWSPDSDTTCIYFADFTDPFQFSVLSHLRFKWSNLCQMRFEIGSAAEQRSCSQKRMKLN